NSPADLLADPHLRATGRFLQTEFKGKRFPLPALPLQSSAYRLGIRHQPPPPGKDTLALLEESGYDRERVAELRRQGVIQVAGNSKQEDER
ncbi:MAG: hypothetical protein HYU75_15815, partial [Betaproteobacteria bacterium]|nr:hypothetical protein [Betaproteobacteria bacterium]